MTRTLPFRVLAAVTSICALTLLPGCPADPAVPTGDAGGGIDSGPRDGGGDTGRADTGGGDTGGGDTGGSDTGGSDTGSADTGGSDAGGCASAAECDDMNPCNGVESCEADGSCGPGTDVDDGTTCDIDADPATDDLCVGGLCGPARCGDTFVGAGEDCDDGNDVAGDGCDACVFSCTTGADCDDGNVCTGTETCGADHICAAGTPAADATPCGSGLACTGGACVPIACTLPADCDNALRCDGVETCTAALCVSGTAPDCDDASPCTADSCSEAGTMCEHTLVDADGDGFASTGLGACGTDCDDTDATTSPDGVDACGDGVDNDCNGTVDDSATTTYYADCDGDDYAAFGAVGVESCLPPPPAMTGCAVGGAWTTRSPVAAMDSDCNDANPAVNPGQDIYQTTSVAGEPIASDFDYNCNGVETRQFTLPGGCMRVGMIGCLYTAGWDVGPGSTVPECGADGTFIEGCTMACDEMPAMRTQSCL